MVDECPWHVHEVLGAGRCRKRCRHHGGGPHLATHPGEGIGQGRERLGIPGVGAQAARSLGQVLVGYTPTWEAPARARERSPSPSSAAHRIPRPYRYLQSDAEPIPRRPVLSAIPTPQIASRSHPRQSQTASLKVRHVAPRVGLPQRPTSPGDFLDKCEIMFNNHTGSARRPYPTLLLALPCEGMDRRAGSSACEPHTVTFQEGAPCVSQPHPHPHPHPPSKTANPRCRFLPPLPPITRIVKLPIRTSPLQFSLSTIPVRDQIRKTAKTAMLTALVNFLSPPPRPSLSSVPPC